MDLKAKGLERVDNFSWQKCAQETLKVYETLINN
jgi:glycosyltransferase involved in cell wall biosynthesis